MKKFLLFPYNVLRAFSKLNSRKNLYKLMNESVDKYCKKNMKIVNIGSGGDVKRILKSRNLEFVETDIDKKRKPDYVCDIEDMSIFKSNSIDIIFCIEVLEHVKNPFNAVKELERVLKPGGVFIGSTPFLFPIHDEPHDYFRYTKYGLMNLFNKFTKVKLVERNSYIESIYVVLLRLLNVGSDKQKFIGFILFPVYIILFPFVLLFSLFVTNYQATTGYFYIFKKK